MLKKQRQRHHSSGIQTVSQEETKKHYDELPYSSYAYMHSAPEQLATIASLFGLPSPYVATARVLELGCASGGNLVPFALRHPRAEAVGVDISDVQIAQGQQYVSRLGIGNARLVVADLQQLDRFALGKFDYVIAHGVYSWVPPEVQEAVLGIIEDCLTPDGVAFVSYNTYPGWKSKEVLRDAMLMHAGKRRGAQEQVAYGRAMLAFLQKVSLKGLTAAALKENLAQIMNSPDNYVAHDYLEPFNLPCYFHEFVERAGRHGLSYLGEAQPSMMMPSSYHPELAQQLYGALGEDQVRVEQYLDFAISRAFRQTLLLRSERAATLRWQLDEHALHRMHFAACLTCAEDAVRLDGQVQEFVAVPGTSRINVGLSGLKQAICLLAGAWPGTVTRDQLIAHAERTQGDQDPVSTEVLGDAIDELLEMLVLRGMARARLEPVEAWTGDGGFVIDPSVRQQLAALAPDQSHIANLWHETVDIGPVERLLVPLMDGTLDRNELVAAAKAALASGELETPEGAGLGADARAVSLVDAMLGRLRDQALLRRPA